MKAWRKQPSRGKGMNRKYKDKLTFQKYGFAGMSELLKKMFERAGIEVNQ